MSPNLPEDPILSADDSMLTRRFGKETINYFAASPLNRYSFLRSDSLFLSAAITSPEARFIALKSLDPFVQDTENLALFCFSEVKGLIGGDPFREEDHVGANDSGRRRGPLVVFLGVRTGNGSGQGEGLGVEMTTEKHGVVEGQPYFAVDVTPRGDGDDEVDGFLQEAAKKAVVSSARNMALKPEDAAMYAQARSIIDWNTRNAFCAGCGQPTIPSQAGFKRLCRPSSSSPSSFSSSSSLPSDCPTRHGTSNISFPRTDPTMIAAVVSADGQRVLLGRQARWPATRYSALAGFLEPGESIEDSVRREVWEESGVRVGRVTIHSSQPWPFPASLMIGAIAQALPQGEGIELNDRELEDARWFSLAQVREALDKGGNSSLRNAEGEAKVKAKDKGEGEVELTLPPPQAIAHRLLRAVVEGYLSAAPKI